MKSLISILLFSLAPITFAAEKNTFNKKWAYTPLIKRTQGTAINETKLFKRYVWQGSLPVALNETTAVIVTNPEGKTDLRDIAHKIQRSFGPALKATHSPTRIQLHGAFKKINRMIDVTLETKGNDFMIVTSFTRLGFAPVLRTEVSDLHGLVSRYFKNRDKKSTTFWNSFSEAVMPKAFAQSLPDPSDILDEVNNLNLNPNPSTPPSTTPSPVPGIGSLVRITSETSSVSEINDNLKTLTTTTNEQASRFNDNLESLNATGASFNDIVATQGSTLNSNLGTFTDTVSEQGQQLNNNLGSINGTVSAQGEALNDNLSSINGTVTEQGQQLNDNLSDIRDTVGTEARALNDNLDGINSTVRAQGDKANQNWAESNRILARTTSPNHMAKVAFYSAAGAALGALTVNLAVQGISTGISFLWELFTESREKKLEWEEFQKAMEVWDTQLNGLVQMELIVDNLLSAFDFFKDKDLGTDYPSILTRAVRDMGFDREMFLEQFRNATLTRECRALYYDAAAELESKIAEYNTVLNLAKGTPAVAANPEAYFCGQLSELKRKILSSEQAMQNLRLRILLAERQFYDKESQNDEWRQKSAGQVAGRLEHSLDEQGERGEEVSKSAKKNAEKIRKDWLRACRRGENSEGVRIRADKSVGFFFGRRRACAKAFRALPALPQAIANNRTQETQLRQGLSILDNDVVEMNLSVEQEQWFAKIHMDAHCYKFAHRPEAMPNECSQYPETLYSMSLSRAFDKAQAAYERSCTQRYREGLSGILAAQ